MKHLLPSIYLACIGLILSSPALAQTIYSESFAGGLNGWTVNNSSAISTSSALASTGYTTPITASGGNNLTFRNCAGVPENIATSPSISTVGKTNIMVGFGSRRTTFTDPINFEFCIDGGTTWTSLSSNVTNPTFNTWAVSVFTLPAAAENQASLIFRFRYAPPANPPCAGIWSFDDFTVSADAPLPVGLINFSAKRAGERVLVSWETTWEQAASHFVVERSPDLTLFSDIGQVTAKGDATARQLYSFSDGEGFRGLSYYRLRQVDTDGSAHFSKIVAVSGSENLLVVCNNPTTGREIRLKASEVDPASVKLQTITGQPLAFHLTQQSPTEWLLRPTVSLRSGMYLLSTGQNNQQRTIKVIVE